MLSCAVHLRRGGPVPVDLGSTSAMRRPSPRRVLNSREPLQATLVALHSPCITVRVIHTGFPRVSTCLPSRPIPSVRTDLALRCAGLSSTAQALKRARTGVSTGTRFAPQRGWGMQPQRNSCGSPRSNLAVQGDPVAPMRCTRARRGTHKRRTHERCSATA
jgi:hypothetical protein